MIELTRRLTEAFGVSGYEDDIRSVIRGEIADLVDDVRVDALGNLVARRKGTGGGKRVMLAAHMDQIGLMITHVDQKGYLRFAPVGYLYALACWGGQVRFADGTVGTVGLDGRVNPTKELPSLEDMFVDVGTTDRSEVRQKVGDVAAFWHPFVAQGPIWLAPNMDDRIGCVLLAQLLHELRSQEIAHDLYAVFTTQEEVGLRGAITSAYAISPEIAIALDVIPTGDTPHAKPEMSVALGHGAAITIQDSGMISHPGLNRLLMATAEAAGVPYQLAVLQGGTTDAYGMQMTREGVPTAVLSVPTRYVHTPSQLVHQRDVEGAIAILRSFLGQSIELS